MSWDDVIASGSGIWACRLVIEGWPDEWVTDDRLATTLSDGRAVHSGLSYSGLGYQERLSIKDGTIDVTPISVQIRSEHAVHSFSRGARRVSMLTQDLDEESTSMEVDSADAYYVGQVVHIGTEALEVTDISGTTVTVTRHIWNTYPQAHRRAGGANAAEVYVYDRPIVMTGRRATLHVHTDPNDPDASQVAWRGFVNRPPSLSGADGLTWSLSLEPITAILQQDIGSSGDAAKLEGIYYHEHNPFRITVWQWTSRWGTVVEERYPIPITGWFATDAEFMSHVNNELLEFCNQHNWVQNIIIERGSFRINFAGNDPGEGFIILIQSAPEPNTTMVGVEVLSGMDGATPTNYQGQVYTRDNDTGVIYQIWEPIEPNRFYYVPVAASNAPEWHPGLWGYAPAGARALVGQHRSRLGALSAPGSGEDAYRIYLDRDVGPVTKIAIEGAIDTSPSGDGGSDRERINVTLDVVDSSGGGDGRPPWVEVSLRNRGRGYYLDGQSEIIPIHDFDINEVHRIDHLFAALVARSHTANDGHLPFIVDDDVDLDDMEDTLDAMALPQWLEQRKFEFREATSLEDILSEECKLLGLMPSITSDGRITLRQLVRPTMTSPTPIQITGEDILTPERDVGSWPSYEPQGDGEINVVQLSTLYDPVEDDHLGRAFEVRHVESLSAHKTRGRGGETSIEPYSVGIGEDQITAHDVYDVASRLWSWLAFPYSVIRLEVSYRLYEQAEIGRTVALTSPHVPDPDTGTMGVANRIGIVMGQEWDLDPASPRAGELLLMVHADSIHGYAPAAIVTGATGASTTWQLSLDGSEYAPSGRSIGSYFLPGFHIEIVEHDSDDPTVLGGVVTDSTVDTVTIEFDTAPPWGGSYSGNWELEFAGASGGSQVHDGQAIYIYVGNSGGRLYDGTSGRVFS